jgi:hypothetical protein
MNAALMTSNDNDFYCYCNLPVPPEWLIEEIKESVDYGYNNNTNMQFEKRPITAEQEKLFTASKNFFKLEGKNYKRAIYRRYNLSEKAGQWVTDNIGPYSQMGSQLMRDGGSFTPHTDGGPRRYIINYLIDAGGPEVKTQFFEEPGYGLYREGPALQLPITGHLKLVRSIVAPEGSWMALFGKVLHAVVDIKSPRIQFSISFSAEEFKNVKEKHGIDLTYHG